jgi:3D (Asp-Asp-Asp) domain-containing protein
MKTFSQIDNPRPPKFGMFLLKLSLLHEYGRSQIGDLEEEYRERCQRENVKAVRIWIQVTSAIRMSLGSPKAGLGLLTKAVAYRSMTHGAISIAFISLITVMSFAPQTVNLEDPLSQQTDSSDIPLNETLPLVSSNVKRKNRQPYSAEAYSLRGRSIPDKPVSPGLQAADPRVLPLGSRVRIDASSYSGEYYVSDRGGSTQRPVTDVWKPSTRGRNNLAVQP